MKSQSIKYCFYKHHTSMLKKKKILARKNNGVIENK